MPPLHATATLRSAHRLTPRPRSVLEDATRHSTTDDPGIVAAPGSARFGWRLIVLLYCVFAIGVALATWPLVLTPATRWPSHYDARVFTWVMASLARRVIADPLFLFHGNAFYPFGGSLALTEPLLPPALLGLAGFRWGDPILTYNVLLLALWPLNGVAMAWAAHGITGSRPAAWLAGAIFCLSPYFTDYYLEFQMLLAAPIPVTLLGWVRWLETQERRWLALALAGLTGQALTSWYYGVILALGLGTLALGFLSLRWRDWTLRRDLTALALGAGAVGVVLLPVGLPYLTGHTELGYARGLTETGRHAADLLTFFEPAGRSLLYRHLPFRLDGGAETSGFFGIVALALAAVSLAWLGDERPVTFAGLRRGLLVAFLVSLGLLAFACAWPRLRLSLGLLVVRPRAGELLHVVAVLGLGLLLLRGWAVARQHGGRRLTRGDWVRMLALLTAVGAVLALGPVMRLGARAVGSGPYAGLYEMVFPLHAIRVTTRFAVLTTAGLALLAALGLARVEARLRSRPWLATAVLSLVGLGLGAEYAVAPAAYERVTAAPRAVDRLLRADPDDVVVLEWPIGRRDADAAAMVRSLWHGKRLVNGLAGFVPDQLRELSELLMRPDRTFPAPHVQAALRRIHPLRYVIVQPDHPASDDEWRAAWRRLRHEAPKQFRFRGTFDSEDLYEVVPLPERGSEMERWISFDFLRRQPMLRLTVRPLAAEAGLDQWVEVRLNGRLLERLALGATATGTVPLPEPYNRAAPNVVTVTHAYRWPAEAFDRRYAVGATGVLSPVDLRVRSGGQPWGDRASIEVNGVERAPGRRGYNLVALQPSGHVAGVGLFDTFDDAEAPRRLVAWVAALPAGTIVPGAVKDEASDRLDEAAVAALATLGVAGDLRGRFRESHAFIGVKGATLGSALESLGSRPVELGVGRADLALGIELAEFRLFPRRSPLPGSQPRRSAAAQAADGGPEELDRGAGEEVAPEQAELVQGR